MLARFALCRNYPIVSGLFIACIACRPAPTHRGLPPARTVVPASVAPLARQEQAGSSIACQEPHSISLLDPNAAATALAADPVAEPAGWLETDDSVRVGNRTFTQKGYDNTLVVKQDEKEIWRSTFGGVAGGFVSFSVSSNGSLVRRGYSRGGVEIFAAASGRRLADAGHGVKIAPDETFAIDPPDFDGPLTQFNRADVKKHTFVPKLTHKTLIRLPLPVRRELKDDSLSPSSFGVAICINSSLYAISFPTTQLAVYRSADDSLLASYANPGPGVPIFTKSGRLIVLDNSPDKSSVFQLSP